MGLKDFYSPVQAPTTSPAGMSEADLPSERAIIILDYSYWTITVSDGVWTMNPFLSRPNWELVE